MLARSALISVALLASLSQSALAQRFNPPRNYMDSALVEMTARAGIHYGQAYEQALHGQEAGLATLFQAGLHTDGAPAELHDSILWEMLQRWGDRRFAAVLRRQSREIRNRVRCSIDLGGCADWTPKYPRTAAIAPSDPNCSCR